MNKSQIIKYLKGKNKDDYTYLDALLDKYCNLELFAFFSKYNFTKIEIYPDISKKGNSMEVNLTYHNIATTINLTDEELEYSIYQLGADVDEIIKNTFIVKYDEKFSFEELINSIYEKMINHNNLKYITLQKKKDIYRIMANSYFCISLLLNVILVLYVIITKTRIQLNIWWAIFTIIIPIILSLIFNTNRKH